MRRWLGWPRQVDSFSCGTLLTAAAVCLVSGDLPSVVKLARIIGIEERRFDKNNPNVLSLLRQALLMIWMSAAVGGGTLHRSQAPFVCDQVME